MTVNVDGIFSKTDPKALADKANAATDKAEKASVSLRAANGSAISAKESGTTGAALASKYDVAAKSANDAAAAHTDASRAHADAGNEDQSRYHANVAASHKDEAQRSSDDAKKATAGGGGGGGKQARDDHGRFDGDGSVLREDFIHLDRNRLGAMQRTQVGGARIPARLSRTGVLTYVNPDGSVRRELRTPEEVFNKDSLVTLEHAPVIDIKDHTGMVTPETWQKVSLGHAVGVTKDGDYMAGELLVNAKEALDAIDRGERTELSCGYRCTLDMTPGTYQGEAYDCIQRDIRYNHVALCPPNRGRAGRDVSMRFDSNAPSWGMTYLDNEGEQTMSNGASTIVKVRLDGRDYEQGSENHLAKLEEIQTTLRLDAKQAVEKLTEVTKRADKAEAERDTAKDSLTKLEEKIKLDAAEAETTKTRETEEMKEKKRHRRKMERISMRYFGDDAAADDKSGGSSAGAGVQCPSCKAMNVAGATKCAKCGADLPATKKRDFAPGTKAPPFKKGGEKGEKEDDDEDDDDDKEKKLDAFEDRIDSMSDRDLMVYCITKAVPDFSDKGPDGKPRSEDYLSARFDSVVEQIKNAHGVNGVVDIARRNTLHLDSQDDADSAIAKARAARDKAMYDAGRTIPSAAK